jgi:hypothetical protein
MLATGPGGKPQHAMRALVGKSPQRWYISAIERSVASYSWFKFLRRSSMDIASAIRSVAPREPDDAIAGLNSAGDRIERHGALANALRAAHLIGQCAHESGGFTRRVESLYYSSGSRIFAVFGRKYFSSIRHAEQFARNQ